MSELFDDVLLESLLEGKKNEEAKDEPKTMEDWMQQLNQLDSIGRNTGSDAEDVGALDADGVHNRGVEFAQRGNKRKAEEICLDGLERFPHSVDLLSDTIEYSSDLGDLETAGRCYDTLRTKVPVARWNWRAFVFSAHYLLKKDPAANEEECRWIIGQYKAWLPYDERACLLESQMEQALGSRDRAMEILQQALCTYPNACQCALMLADMQMERGLYEAAAATARYGMAASVEAQPHINVPYLCFLQALAKDYLLHKKVCEGKTADPKECSDLEREYNLLLEEFPQLLPYRSTIRMRLSLLKLLRGSQEE